MARNVRILDEKVINKIAAGEVIENPASVCKELIENSVDAEATRIDVDIEKSGMKSIRIADNGCGMSRENAIMALERHATSKLTSDQDLFSLHTLGFRGEALPSIAAVSKFLMRTAQQQELIGTRIQIDGGKVYDVSDDQISPGTIIEVKELFFNVPARKKFMRSYHAEKMAVNQIFLKLALSQPLIQFTLSDEGKEVYNLIPTNNIAERIATLFGRDFCMDLIPFSAEGDDFKFHGYISHPQLCRNTRSGQYIFVNTRIVQSYQISSVIQKAYGTLLPNGRFPIFFLYLTVDPSIIDVNVHPTKKEIKFSHVGSIETMLRRSIEAVLKDSKLIFDIKEQNDELKKIDFSYNIPRFTNVTPPDKKESASSNFFASQEETQPVKNIQPAQNPKPEPAQTIAKDIGDDDFLEQLESIIEHDHISTPSSPVSDQDNTTEQTAEITNSEYPNSSTDFTGIRIIGQIGKCFILAESREGLIIIDQHAAHERVNFERIMESMHANTIDSQSIMFPVTYQVDSIRKKALVAKLDLLRKAGIGITEFGSDTFLIDALPSFISYKAVTAVLDDLIEESQKTKSDSIADWQIKLAKMMACRGSVKAADKLEQIELEKLIDDLFKTRTPYTCPHGRPTIIRMTYEQLRKHFRRE
ncbi:MAG: DNA mismatch repair endonuclease MutL [Candidatus Auribacterota bacterium]|jgi:DNA mismatch repair protein MutL|nr:DNA mismatch repair endonuclease MutL [Candidatus Auribacterota bacterium]